MLAKSEPFDALAIIVRRSRAESRGRSMCEKLKDLIPPQLFQFPIQAAIGAKVMKDGRSGLAPPIALEPGALVGHGALRRPGHPNPKGLLA